MSLTSKKLLSTLRRKSKRLHKLLRLQRRRMMKLHQSRVKIPKMTLLLIKTRRTPMVMTRSMRLIQPHQRKPMPSREETRKLIRNLTKLKKRTSQLPPKSTLSQRPSPLLRRNPRLLIKKSSKRPLTPPRKKLKLPKLNNKRPDLRRLEKERDVPDSSHQSSAHSRLSKNLSKRTCAHAQIAVRDSPNSSSRTSRMPTSMRNSSLDASRRT